MCNHPQWSDCTCLDDSDNSSNYCSHDDEAWVVNTNVRQHLCSNDNQFRGLDWNYNSLVSVHGEDVAVVARGHVALFVKGDLGCKKLVLRNVGYAPDLRYENIIGQPILNNWRMRSIQQGQVKKFFNNSQNWTWTAKKDEDTGDFTTYLCGYDHSDGRPCNDDLSADFDRLAL